MNAKYSASEVFDYWTCQAQTYAQSPTALWSAIHAIELENWLVPTGLLRLFFGQSNH